ncbi:MAG TPA: citrate lyase subunit beta-like protein, partial [Moraxellaceae bacterium]|nr:citrate lyase subunit beta-like protein [Moraxellaceae bacterium]
MTLLHPVNHFLPASVAPTINPYQLGATLYMPATRQDIWQIISQQKLAEIDSIVICLEDAVSESEIPAALANLKQLLATWAQHAQTHGFGDESRPISRPMVFIRPRNALMLTELASWQSIALVDGFVLPKIDMQSLADWRLACQALPSTQLLMPTLETRLIFNPIHNQELALAFSEGFSQSILALRIGGNDLFASLRLRRPSDVTIYQTPVGILIYQLIACFVPQGFYLTAPVFEYLDKP